MKETKKLLTNEELDKALEDGLLQDEFIYGSITESKTNNKKIYGTGTIKGKVVKSTYSKNTVLRFLYDDGTYVIKNYYQLLSEKLLIEKDQTVKISKELYDELNRIGLIPSENSSFNVGSSDYASNLVQPWVIFNAHPNLNYQECDIIKRIMRTKKGDSRLLDLEKIKHIVDELIRQEKLKDKNKNTRRKNERINRNLSK